MKWSIQRYVPFAAVAAANCVNIPLMRQTEIGGGIELTDDDGKKLTRSKVSFNLYFYFFFYIYDHQIHRQFFRERSKGNSCYSLSCRWITADRAKTLFRLQLQKASLKLSSQGSSCVLQECVSSCRNFQKIIIDFSSFKLQLNNLNCFRKFFPILLFYFSIFQSFFYQIRFSW